MLYQKCSHNKHNFCFLFVHLVATCNFLFHSLHFEHFVLLYFSDSKQVYAAKSVTVQDREKAKVTRQHGPNWKDRELELLTDHILANMKLLRGEL